MAYCVTTAWGATADLNSTELGSTGLLCHHCVGCHCRFELNQTRQQWLTLLESINQTKILTNYLQIIVTVAKYCSFSPCQIYMNSYYGYWISSTGLPV